MSNHPITPASSPHEVVAPLQHDQPENPLLQQGYINQVPVVHIIPQDNEHDGYTTPPVMQRPMAPPNQRAIYEEAKNPRSSGEKRKINVIASEPDDIIKKSYRDNPPPPPPPASFIVS